MNRNTKAIVNPLPPCDSCWLLCILKQQNVAPAKPFVWIWLRYVYAPLNQLISLRIDSSLKPGNYLLYKAKLTWPSSQQV